MGRPRIYEKASERNAAYRERVKAEQAAVMDHVDALQTTVETFTPDIFDAAIKSVNVLVPGDKAMPLDKKVAALATLHDLKPVGVRPVPTVPASAGTNRTLWYEGRGRDIAAFNRAVIERLGSEVFAAHMLPLTFAECDTAAVKAKASVKPVSGG